MTRAELTALHDAIDTTLALPDSIRELLAQWLAPTAAKPNGILTRLGTRVRGFRRVDRRPRMQARAPRQADPGASGRAAASCGDAR